MFSDSSKKKFSAEFILLEDRGFTVARNFLLSLTLFRMGFFGAAHGWGGGAFWPSLPKIRHTYPTMMKLGTVIPYLRKIQKVYESRDTSL